MKRFIAVACLIVLCLYATAQAGPNPAWSTVPKAIAIQSGNSISAWQFRGDLTNNGTVYMTPDGTGLWEYKAFLTPGGIYNYMFFAISTSAAQVPADSDLKQNVWYNDTVNDAVGQSGFNVCYVSAGSTVNVSGQNWAYGGSVGGDGRRIIQIPTTLPAGATVYVFNNFASSPTVNTLDSLPGIPDPTSISISWAPYGRWTGQYTGENSSGTATFFGTTGEENKAADVLAGGLFRIYFSSTVDGADPEGNGPYSLLISTTRTSYVHSGLTIGNTYHYIVALASDAYTGAPGGQQTVGQPWFEIENEFLARPTADAVPDEAIRLMQAVPVYFKVDGLDWDKVKLNDYLVWLTPVDKDARTYPYKIPGRIIRVYLPREDEI